jgi:predicted nucleic acid-binding protein
MSVPVVSNAGPLMVLAKLNLLHLLKEVYGRVYFSGAVYAEVVQAGIRSGYQDAFTLRQFFNDSGWQPTSDVVLTVQQEAFHLDLGEKESIALALSLRGSLLMDEERGRRYARQSGLLVRGTLGTLVEAHSRGIISPDQLRLYFHQIESRPDIWISPSLTAQLLVRVLGDTNR